MSSISETETLLLGAMLALAESYRTAPNEKVYRKRIDVAVNKLKEYVNELETDPKPVGKINVKGVARLLLALET